MDGYDQPHMGLEHPLDAALRARLRQAGLNQVDTARAIGRKQSWLNKYMHGAGNATVDDVVRLVALLIGVEAQQLTEPERRLLRAWRQIAMERRDDAVIVLENVAKGYRPPRSQESIGPAARKPAARGRKANGTR